MSSNFSKGLAEWLQRHFYTMQTKFRLLYPLKLTTASISIVTTTVVQIVTTTVVQMVMIMVMIRVMIMVMKLGKDNYLSLFTTFYTIKRYIQHLLPLISQPLLGIGIKGQVIILSISSFVSRLTLKCLCPRGW